MWYAKITKDMRKVPEFIAYYEKELLEAREEVKVRGSIDKNLAALPGITEHRFAQLQEIEAVLNFVNIELRKERTAMFRKYLENYNRALSSRDAEKYADGEQSVIDWELIINEVALLRNKYLGILKGLESKGFSLNNITRLRAAGLDDMMLGNG